MQDAAGMQNAGYASVEGREVASRSVKQLKVTKTLNFGCWRCDARCARCFRDAKPWICKCGREGGCCCDSEMHGCYKHDVKNIVKAQMQQNRNLKQDIEWCKGCLRSR